jgi:hypothetical protein
VRVIVDVEIVAHEQRRDLFEGVRFAPGFHCHEVLKIQA